MAVIGIIRLNVGGLLPASPPRNASNVIWKLLSELDTLNAEYSAWAVMFSQSRKSTRRLYERPLFRVSFFSFLLPTTSNKS